MCSDNNTSNTSNNNTSNATDNSAWKTLRIVQNKGDCTIWLNRPNVKNAMNHLMVQELTAFFTALSTHCGKIRAVIIRGEGDIFCAGADLEEMAALRAQAISKDRQQEPQYETHPIYHFNRDIGKLLCCIQQCPAVVIAAVHGAALGGGFGLVCAADFACVTTDTLLGMPETRLGILPAQIAPFVIQRIGLSRAKRIALLGQKLTGDQAHAIGLIDEVITPPHTLDETLNTLCANIHRCAPFANARTKNLLHQSSAGVSESLLDQAACVFTQALLSDEGQEGNAAFLEKRRPAWVDS